jgi:dihydrofolate synthase/folylpolyglutamate synthase
MMRSSEYQKAVNYLYGLQRLGIKFGLDNITRLLTAIGNPHDGLPAIHIAGSNGKGSTAAHLESVLLEAGYRVALYTSPHFVHFTERIRVNRERISERDVAVWTRRLQDALPDSIPITFFEFTTAMAMAYFVEQCVDLAILEVGMGGRLDATNVCQPLLCMVTTISLEHQDILGKTISEITREKAGIVKSQIPVISGLKQPRPSKILEESCLKHGAPLFRLGKEFHVRGGPENFTYEGLQTSLQGCQTSLRGRHQVRNAALALAAVEILNEKQYRIDEKAVLKGLKTVSWRGRQEWLQGPPQILLDGAHNPEAMRSLRYSLMREFHYEKLRVLMGIMKEKDHRRMIECLVPLAHEFVFSRPRMERSQDPWILKAVADRLGCPAEVVEDVSLGFQRLMEKAEDGDLVCITGSLFVVGEVIGRLEKNHSLIHRRSA